MKTIKQKQQAEIDFWVLQKNRVSNDSLIHNTVSKMTDAVLFLQVLRENKSTLKTTGKVIELGCGQGWAACLYQKKFPETRVIATDISPIALEQVEHWEHTWNTQLYKHYACKSYQTQEATESIDMVFTMKAAHHFLRYEETLAEIYRILKKGGVAHFFYEPNTPKIFYPITYHRANKKRKNVFEDVLKVSELKEAAKQIGLQCEVQYFPSTKKRTKFDAFLYYSLLKKVPFLQRMLPCTVNIIFKK